jgi:hypothetical protein
MTAKKAAKAAAPAVPPAELDKPADKVEGETPPPADDSEGDGTPNVDKVVVAHPDDVPEVGLIGLPCARCYPNGWPVEELGAWANCSHGHGIRYGEQVEITRERAVELGFLEADPT